MYFHCNDKSNCQDMKINLWSMTYKKLLNTYRILLTIKKDKADHLLQHDWI